MDPRRSRGYRNRNPGNIDFRPANAWKGQVGLGDAWLAPANRRFALFEDHVWGIRALARLLLTYQSRHGLDTVREIIGRWAPPVENDSGAYVRAVARRTGFGADQRLDLTQHAQLRPLVEAIIHHEIGGQPYGGALLDEALALAGVRP